MEATVIRLNEICKELVETDGKLGAGKKFVRFEIDAGKSGKDQFAAAAIFGNILTEDANTVGGGESSFPVVIKTEPQDPATREFYYSSSQFHNEILFYTRLLPFLNSFRVGNLRETSYPFAKFLKGGTNDPVLRSYLILKNASNDGFKLSENRQLLDLEHFLLIMNRLGRFHGLSYVAKHVDSARLLELTAQIKETSWTDERVNNVHENDFLLKGSLTRAIENFDNPAVNNHTSGNNVEKSGNVAKENGETVGSAAKKSKQTSGDVDNGHDLIFGKYREQVDRVKKLLIGKPTRFMRDITTPHEPMAVLNHGDFCRNNILFKYSDNDAYNSSESADKTSSPSSTPREALFFDMATIRYASPVIDLSFCIYLNSNAEMRRLHWDKIIRSYHEGVRESVEVYARENGVEVTEGKHNFSSSSNSIFLPSLQDVHSEFSLHALYGLVHCSFFLPMMMDTAFLESSKEEAVDFWNLPTEEKVRLQNLVAGDSGTQALNDIVMHLFEMGFV